MIVDLTNRCNMLCSPCYMDANATSYVHELDMQDVTDLFARAMSFKPQREINVLFSGGEATLSPIFLEAVRHAKSMGFHRLHVATNGIRFAQEKDFAAQAKAAGLHAVYLQFDGVTEEKNSHRGIGNYMDVKRRALDNIAAAGMKTTLQVTVVNGLNNDGLGDIIRFVAEHVEKIHGVIFQPIMFCGRDEDISDDERYARRYPVSQIAYDLQAQTSIRLGTHARLVSRLCLRGLRQSVRCAPSGGRVREPLLRYPSQSRNVLPDSHQFPHTRNCPRGKVLRRGAILP